MVADVVQVDRLSFGILEEQAVDDELRQRWGEVLRFYGGFMLNTREFNIDVLLSVTAAWQPGCRFGRDFTRRQTGSHNMSRRLVRV